MSEPNLELTVLMPCLNEAETVGRCVQKALACIARLGLQAEVLVADNGSTDGSISCAEQAGARVVHVAARGYGAALYHGVLAARGRFIVMGERVLGVRERLDRQQQIGHRASACGAVTERRGVCPLALVAI